MKRLSVLFFFFIIYNLNSQWEVVSMNPETQMLKSIVCLDDSTIISVGYYETILRSQDYGLNWKVVNSDNHFNILNDVAFNDELIMAIGNNALILKSIDNGFTWSKMELGITKDLKSICFNDNFGIIVGQEGIILYSNDFGNHWDQIQINNVFNNFNQVDFINDSKALIIGDMGFVASLNVITKKIEIKNWGIKKELFCFSMNPNGKIIIGSENKLHIRTDNSLKEFKYLKSELIPDKIFNVLYVNDSLILSTIQLTTTQKEAFSIDDGKTWHFGIYNGTPISSFDLTPNKEYAYLCGRRGEIVRINLEHLPINQKYGALDTTVHFVWENYNFKFLDGIDDKNIITGEDKRLLISTDSGYNFKEVLYEPGGFSINDIKFANNNIVVLSDSGFWFHYPMYKEYKYKSVIRVSYDQGKNFKTFEFFNNDFGFWRKLSFFHNYGIAFRKYNNKIAVTDDAGNSWEVRQLPNNLKASVLKIVDDNTFYGTVLDSNDNVFFIRCDKDMSNFEINKLPKGLKNFFNISDIDFINKSIGWCIYHNYNDSTSIIYKTINQGRTWENVFNYLITNDNGLQYIDFADENIGAALTYEGNVYITTNGGTEWVNKPIQNYSRLGSLYFSPSKYLFAVIGKELWRLTLNSLTQVSFTKNSIVNKIKIYPNPSYHQITLNFNNEYNYTSKISIYNILGLKVSSISAKLVKGENNIPINTFDLPKGLYFVNVFSGNIQHKTMFIKK